MSDEKMKLTGENVNMVFMNCLFKEGENTSNHIPVEGITVRIGFHPERLEKNRQNIIDMLSQLPEQFHEGTGDGWSFLNACNNRAGEQWTGLQTIMEQLFCLGMAIDKVECPLPRDMWSILPGSMPFYMVRK